MKFFSKGEAVYDTQLYNYFVTVGSYIEETLLELKKENNDNFNMYFDEVTRLVSIKKDDTVTKGQIIGKSGTNKIDKDMGNHLHFELYANGQTADPNLYIDKEIKTKE